MSHEPLGDLAERMAKRLETDVSAPVQEATAITEEAALSDLEGGLFTKIRFSWSAEDRAALERIRIASDSVTQAAFLETFEVIDWFYEQLRVPRRDPNTGMVLKDTTGRTVWETDDQGRPLEQWSQLTGQDIEQTMMNLERIRLYVAPQVQKLFLEALLAQQSAKDAYDKAWGTLMDGTQGDRTARSNRESQVDRYHAYFRFYIYSVAKSFLDEMGSFMRSLDRVRYSRIQAQQR
jgi:hypothetical protein